MQNDAKAQAAIWAKTMIDGDAFLVLDTETTGPDRVHDRPVQISIIDQDGVALVNQLLDPTILISKGASDVHGITNEMVRWEPKFREYWPTLAEVLKRPIPVIIYNALFDAAIIHTATINAGVSEQLPDLDVHCAMLKYAAFWGDWNDYRHNYRWQKLSVACQQQGIEVKGAHDALGDCLMTLALVKKMAEWSPDNGT